MGLRIVRLTCCLILLVYAFTALSAQQRPPKGIPSKSYDTGYKEQADSLASLSGLIKRDTLSFQYYHLSDINDSKNYADTSLSSAGLTYDKARNPLNHHASLGNNGSAAMPLTYQVAGGTGFNAGFVQHDVYRISLDSFRFYKVNRPVADLQFTPILGSQQNFIVGANFGQQFKDSSVMSINYHRVSQVGFYANQATKLTNFGLGFGKVSMKGKLSNYLTSISNVNVERTNGGASTDTLFEAENFNFRTRIPVYTSGAATRNENRSIGIHSIYRLGDTIVEASDIVVQHGIFYDHERYKFYDSTSTNRSSIYGGEYAFDDRGLRYFLDVTRIKNSFTILTATNSGIRGRVGIMHELIRFNQELDTKTRNDITAFGNGTIPIGKYFNIYADAKVGLGSNIAKFDINGTTNFKVKSFANLSVAGRLFNLENPYIAQQLVLNNKTIFSNESFAINGLTLRGTLAIPMYGTTITIQQSTVNNALYWDSRALPQKVSGILSQSTINIQQDVSIKAFHLDQVITAQKYSSSNIKLPTWYSYHNLYWTARLFKKVLNLRLGAEAFIIPSYEGVNFSPVVGQFYNANNTIIPSFTQANLYLQGQISNFRVFFKLENVEDYIRPNIDYQVGTNPFFDARMRLGFRWLLLD